MRHSTLAYFILIQLDRKRREVAHRMSSNSVLFSDLKRVFLILSLLVIISLSTTASLVIIEKNLQKKKRSNNSLWKIIISIRKKWTKFENIRWIFYTWKVELMFINQLKNGEFNRYSTRLELYWSRENGWISWAWDE